MAAVLHRYGLGLNPEMHTEVAVLETDVLVIGAGGAGCQAAITASDTGERVVLMEKGRLGLSGGTFDPFTLGKGITVAAAGFNPTDDPEPHYQLALEAGRGLAFPPLARIVAYEAAARFGELVAAGAPFRPNRLPACFGGAMVGAFIDQSDLARFFRQQVGSRPIRVLERTMAVSLIMREGECAGAIAVNRDGIEIAVHAGATILATGGASPVFRYNFTSSGLTGDGYLLGLAAGAELTNLEFYQSILGSTAPAHVYFPQWYLAGAPAFTDVSGRAYLVDYLPPGVDPEQIIRDRGAHGPFSASYGTRWFDIALDAEIRAGHGSAPPDDPDRLAGVYCHFNALPAGLRRELDVGSARPSLDWLRARGVDVEHGPVPVALFAHAFNGGIAIGEDGSTGVPRLYACGEVAAGPHGANRVGGHMFAVLLVFGARAGRAAALSARRRTSAHEPLALPAWPTVRPGPGLEAVRPHLVRRAIQQAMAPIMITKSADALERAARSLRSIRQELLPRVSAGTPHERISALEVANLMRMAELLQRSATLRRETRGPHFRSDYPEEAAECERHLVWRRSGAWGDRWDCEPLPKWSRPSIWGGDADATNR